MSGARGAQGVQGKTKGEKGIRFVRVLVLWECCFFSVVCVCFLLWSSLDRLPSPHPAGTPIVRSPLQNGADHTDSHRNLSFCGTFHGVFSSFFRGLTSVLSAFPHGMFFPTDPTPKQPDGAGTPGSRFLASRQDRRWDIYQNPSQESFVQGGFTNTVRLLVKKSFDKKSDTRDPGFLKRHSAWTPIS